MLLNANDLPNHSIFRKQYFFRCKKNKKESKFFSLKIFKSFIVGFLKDLTITGLLDLEFIDQTIISFSFEKTRRNY